MVIASLPVLTPCQLPPPGSRILVHIGKCGGSSLRMALKGTVRAADTYVSHISPPPISPDYQYIICVRNPVARAFSAFHWRKKLVIEDGQQADRFPREKEALELFRNFEALCLALPQSAQSFRAIHHLREDISFYLTELLDRLPADNIAAVLTQERLNTDIERCFDQHNRYAVNRNNPNPTAWKTLQPKALSRVQTFLRADFQCIQRLHEIKKLDDEALDLMSIDPSVIPD